ncbi:MAG TPA: tetratricopeptide repeat protein [Moraxellaceae bacterium]|nr:tetratricopeptide repeat protein [Moraxellaceae bacterium]
MKPSILLRASAIMATLLIGGCAAPLRQTQPTAPMDVSSARAVLRSMPGHATIAGSSALATLYRIDSVTMGSDSIRINDHVFHFSDMHEVTFSPSHTSSMGTPVQVGISPDYDIVAGFDEQANAYGQQIADALLTLRNATSPEAKARADAAFADVAARYRQADPKPDTTEDMRRAQIQAEGAVRDKDFAGADAIYERMLDAVPWWPQGHFNRALILESEQDYDGAVAEMKRYLALVPEATNARAAQDKVYEWERKAGH